MKSKFIDCMQRWNLDESFGSSLDLNNTYDIIPIAVESASHDKKTPGISSPPDSVLIDADVSNDSNVIDYQNECNVLEFSNRYRTIYGLGTIHIGEEEVEGLKRRRTRQIELFELK